MLGNLQVRFGGGRMEKDAAGYPSLPMHMGSRTPASDGTSPAAYPTCVGLFAIPSLSQEGDSWASSLGRPSHPRPKGTGDKSMTEKRGYVEIGETGPRKTHVAWSKLDRLNPNPGRGLSSSVVRPIEHDVIECRPFPFWGYGKPAR